MRDLTKIEFGRWIDAAPRQVQETIVSDATAQTVEAIGKKYRLHVDAIGFLYKLVGYVLVGYVPFDTLPQEIRQLGVDPLEVRKITQDIQDQILVPLSEQIKRDGIRDHQNRERIVDETPQPQERGGGEGERLIAAVAAGGFEPVLATPPTPKAWQPKAADTITVLPQGIYAPPLQSPRYTSQPLVPDAYIHETISLNKLQELGGAKKPSRPATATKTPEPVARVATASTPQVREEAPLTRRLESDTPTPDHLLEDHEEPHMEVPGVHPVPRQTLFSTFPTGGFRSPTPPVGPGSVPQATVPTPPRPSQTLPGSLPSTPVEKATPPRPIAPVPLAPVAPPSHYGVDPYREPLEP
jgi:hypothetical protein